MYIKKIILSVLIFLVGFSGFSQDKIYLKNKDVILGKILRVTSQNVEIDPEGDKPFLLFDRDEISVIIYEDNTVVTLTNSTQDNIESKVIREKPRIQGFRTDGYYITKFPFLYKYRKNIGYPFVNAMGNSSNQNLYIAFRVLPDNINDGDDYREIQVAMFIQRKSQMKKTLKETTHADWKYIHETFLNKDKVNRDFIENDLRKKNDNLVFVLFKWDNPHMLINDPGGITLFIGNYFGFDQDVPRADFLIGKSSTKWKHPSNKGIYNEWEFTKSAYDKMFSTNRTAEQKRYWSVYKNHELIFIPD